MWAPNIINAAAMAASRQPYAAYRPVGSDELSGAAAIAASPNAEAPSPSANIHVLAGRDAGNCVLRLISTKAISIHPYPFPRYVDIPVITPETEHVIGY
jgi:hypothetical protein